MLIVGIKKKNKSRRRKNMRYVISRSTPSLMGFDTIFNDLFGDVSSSKIPPVDIYETANSYVIEAEVAGYKDSDLKIGVHKHVLSISSDESWIERFRKEKASKKFLVNEISLPEFSRSFALPEDADEGNISAENRNGILTVRIPKIQRAENGGRIEVKIN